MRIIHHQVIVSRVTFELYVQLQRVTNCNNVALLVISLDGYDHQKHNCRQYVLSKCIYKHRDCLVIKCTHVETLKVLDGNHISKLYNQNRL